VDVILSRDPSKLSALSLKGMLDDGNAAGVAQMMLESEKIFPAFLELLVHEKWPVRLGAMVAFESIVEQNKNLAAEVVTPLLKAFSKAEDTLKGDILYVLGESRDTRVIPKLKAVLTEPHDHEVKAAAVEALEKLEN
jgi:HEAT repeat protein